MIIQHNIMALNSYNKLSTNNSAVQKNLEKLSSGYRINRAGDDAAGLAISEKMRAQITGLERAKLNAQDGISLVQTAEGALTEVHSMLNRLVELGTESANGIYQAEDREKIQSEVDQITEEIDRISKATNFNGIKLLDGSLSTTTKNAASAGGAQVLKGAEVAEQAATNGVYEVTFKNTGDVKGASGTAGYAVDLTLTMSDDSQVKVRVILDGGTTSAGVKQAIVDAINGDEKLGKLFSVTATGNDKVGNTVNDLKLTFTAKDSGSQALGIKSIQLDEMTAQGTTDGQFQIGGEKTVFTNTVQNGQALSASTTTKATDKFNYLDFNDGVTPNKNSTITIGDHTFEFKEASDYDIKSGNVRVVMGENDRETLQNLMAAMKLKGIDSVSLTDDNKLRIDDLSQLKASSGTTLEMSSKSPGIKFDSAAAQNGKVTLSTTVTGGAVLANASFTIKYKTADGEEKSYTVTGINESTNTTSAALAAKIVDAINKDDTLKELFTASNNKGEISIESKNDKNGAEIKGVESSNINYGNGGGVSIPAIDATKTQTAHGSGQTLEIDYTNLNSKDTLTVGGKTFRFMDDADAAKPENLKDGEILVRKGANAAETSKNLQAALTSEGIKFKDQGVAGTKATLLFEHGTEQKQEVVGGLTLQIGDTADDFNKVTVSVDDMSSAGLGIDNLQVTDQGLAAESIDKVKSAIEKVSVNRGRLGALQNRLEHTINNLATTTENMTAAESRIRDTDMAKEMMHFTKNNVLVQAAQSMLAQANQQPQQVLQLLR